MLVGHPFDTVKVSVLSWFYSQVFVEAQTLHRGLKGWGVWRPLSSDQGTPARSSRRFWNKGRLRFCDTQVDGSVSAFLLGLALHLPAQS